MHWTPRQVSNTKHFCWSKHRSFNDLSGLLLGPNTDTLSDFCSLFLNFFRLIPKGGAWFGICGQRGNSNFHRYIINIYHNYLINTACFLVACPVLGPLLRAFKIFMLTEKVGRLEGDGLDIFWNQGLSPMGWWHEWRWPNRLRHLSCAKSCLLIILYPLSCY